VHERARVAAVRRGMVYEKGKRVLDLVLAGGVLLFLAPVLLLVVAAIRLESGGPAMFRQDRVGKDGTIFRVSKFRTMRVGAHTSGEGGKVREDRPLDPQDPAITRVGRLLRATSLDELPQLINVLRGEMSLVGPRPTIPEQAARYGPRERIRLSVPPGLTGLAQVSGRNELSWPERIEIDLDYVARRSFALDLAIILRTPWALIRRRGVYRRGE